MIKNPNMYFISIIFIVNILYNNVNGILQNSHDYLQEMPVKLLDVRSMATRYPASDSGFRINVENGYVS